MTKFRVLRWCLIFISICVLHVASAQQNADFLIVQNPLQLTIINKYEQPLDENSKAAFLPYAPFQITKKEVVLGDQISKGVEILFRNQTYFIIKTEKGGLGGDSKDNYKKMFVNSLLVNDTIIIDKANTVRLSERYDTDENVDLLQKDELLIRIFKYGNKYYVQRTGMEAQYGWCVLEQKDVWKKIEAQVKTTESASQQSQEAYQMIADRMQAVNKIYTQYFGFFNEKSKQGKTIPQWDCSVSGNILVCKLSGIFDPSQLAPSTQYLKQDIENILIGKSFSVNYSDGTITITPLVAVDR